MAGKKGSSPKVHQYFKIEGEKAIRVRKNCIRCGKGVYMSNHKDRHTCGKCGDTEFNQN